MMQPACHSPAVFSQQKEETMDSNTMYSLRFTVMVTCDPERVADLRTELANMLVENTAPYGGTVTSHGPREED